MTSVPGTPRRPGASILAPMRRFTIALLAVAAFAVPAAAWNNLTGQPAPDIEAKEWFNVGRKAPSNKELLGKVVLIEIFGVN